MDQFGFRKQNSTFGCASLSHLLGQAINFEGRLEKARTLERSKSLRYLVYDLTKFEHTEKVNGRQMFSDAPKEELVY